MSVSSKEDCHYYYYTLLGCNKIDCEYKHEPASKGVELRCPQYLQNKTCTTPSCPLRHKVLDKARDSIDCFFEKSGMCEKADCPFKHSKERKDSSETSENVIQVEKFTCILCNVSPPGEIAYQNHLKGKKHLKKLKERTMTKSKNVAPTTPISFKCVPCNVSSMNEAENDEHCKSLIHKEKTSSAILRNPPFHCTICKQTLKNKLAFDEHKNSPEHLAKAKRSRQRPKSVSASNSSSSLVDLTHLNLNQPLPKGNAKAPSPNKKLSPPFQCRICNQTLQNKFFYDQHMNSLEHQTRVNGSRIISGSSSSTSLFNFDHLDLNQPPPPADLKVGVFWDLENCPLSSKMDIPGVVHKLKKDHGNNGVFDQFVGACNMENHKRVAITMQELGMDILPVLNNKKNAADDLLKNKMMSFAENPRCRIILISGDVDFSQNLLHYREQKRHEVLLFHNDMARESLKSVVTKAFRYQGFIRPFVKDTPDRTRSKSAVRGDKNRPKKAGKAVLFFWDMMSLPAPPEVTVGSVVSKLRNIFLCGTETIEAGFAACRSISQMGAVNHVAQMSVELSLDSPVDMLKHQLETKKDVDILILLTNDIGLGETIRKLKNERKIQIHLIRDEKCQEPLAYSLDEQSQESFQEFIKSLINPMSLGEKCEQGVPLNQNSTLDSRARFLPKFFSKFAAKEN